MVLDTNFFEFNDKEYLQQDGIGKTQNAVYSIDCEKRGHIVYVGETGTSLYERFQNTIQYNTMKIYMQHQAIQISSVALGKSP